jgi:sulfur-oxidizing protein SoxB
MVRVGGLSYTCSPTETIGKRISDLRLDGDKTLEAGKTYKVAGWASVNPQTGKPISDVLADYLRSGKTSLPYGSNVTLKGVDGNPGMSG